MPTKRKFTFDDLVFKPISESSRTRIAHLEFSNHYGCNVYERSSNTNRWLPYEFELTFNGHPTANEEISDGNVGYSSKDDISTFIQIAQRL